MKTNLDPATFGNPVEYRTLPLIMDRLSVLSNKDRNYLSKFLIRFNRICKHLVTIPDSQFFENCVNAFRQEYRQRCKDLLVKYEPYLVEHIENFVITKLKKVMNERKVIAIFNKLKERSRTFVGKVNTKVTFESFSIDIHKIIKDFDK